MELFSCNPISKLANGDDLHHEVVSVWDWNGLSFEATTKISLAPTKEKATNAVVGFTFIERGPMVASVHS